ncbi:GDP-mannose 4,6-dehydratase [Paenibacillus humicus]|uniref:GDP-mannose 4,6-dehydratase n=1 Tax=Paenibacillus humicus TaxID=412861 RepID=UPI0013E2ABAB|nr:GDP-mannose 4,6-dehydratase [Paenibacillus humicus]
MRALITGYSGFVGQHLAARLSALNYEVFGTTRSTDLSSSIIQLLQCNLNDEEGVIRLLNQVRPNEIYHLAGQSSVHLSWLNKVETFESNANTTLTFLEAIRKSIVGQTAKILTIGSSEEYGKTISASLPINEYTPTNPISPYGLSKTTVSMLARYFYQNHGMHIVHSRPFTHIGPGQKLGFVTSDFAKQIADIEKGLLQPTLSVGNLESKRDFTDVRDIVVAYQLLLTKGKPGEVYNVCSGKAVAISDILQTYIEISTCAHIEVRQDPNKMRPSDFPVYYGDARKITAATGWNPEISFSDSLNDILNYWRNCQ